MIKNLEEFNNSVTQAIDASTAYYNGKESELTDAEYDLLIEAITEATKQNPEWVKVPGVTELLHSVASGVGVGGSISHNPPMLSLDKKKDAKELASFLSYAEDSTVILEPKVDGIAITVRYENGSRTVVATRGNGVNGEDITSRVESLSVTGLPKTVGKPYSFEVRGELYMSPSDFEFSNNARVAAGHQPFANPRNATSGTVMRETVRYDARVSFAAYEVFDDNSGDQNLTSDSYVKRMSAVNSLGINRVIDLLPEEVQGVISNDGLLSGVVELGRLRDEGLIDAPTDGCVLKLDSTEKRNQLGVSSRHPRWAVAYKYEAVRAETTLLDIERAVGRTGNISYTAVLEQVEVDGSMVRYATLHNNDFITANDLRIGDTVTLWKAGDIIPRIEKPVLSKRPTNATPYVAPTTCPKCENELNRNQVIWRCETPSCSIVGLLVYAASRDVLDIDGLSVGIIESLVDQGKLTRLADLFSLTVADLENLELGGNNATRILGNKTAVKIVNRITAAKNQPLNRIICSLGIRMTGRGMSRRLASHFRSMDALLAATEDDFLNSGIDAVGPTRAAAFVKGFAEMSEDVNLMKQAGVNMTMEDETPANTVLAGKKVCVTGSMRESRLSSLTRTGMTELIESYGGTPTSSVSSSTDILVCAEEGSSKHKKAVELGKQILTPNEFADLLGI